jgi:hypothetical protein
VHLPDKQSAISHLFFPVHSGTANIHFGFQGLDVVLPIQVTNCVAGDCTPQLGSAAPFTLHPEFDNFLMRLADRNGIPPQLLKAQVHQESRFFPRAFRYEPLSIDFSQIAAPKGTPFGLLRSKRLAPWALATSDDCSTIIQAQGTRLNLTSADATARQSYGLAVNRSGQPLCRVTDATQVTSSRAVNGADQLPTMENLFYTNDNDAGPSNWLALASKKTSQRFFDYQVDNPPFTAQTVIASSYGLHQLLYDTAVGMGYKGKDAVGLAPGGLFDPATSLDLGTEYLAQMFVDSDGTEQADYATVNELLLQFAPALRGFNAGEKQEFSVSDAKTNCSAAIIANDYQYACGIIKRAPNYDPVPLPSASVEGGGGGGPSF